ncbi:SDR family oxidoreductase [Planctomyces sp. SH-PL14]|uniref:SDR family oxidoreductase n=1 Tax=Planctomyces sp. SH-PL14 TaxID=1632864 RepID=UPI00078D26BE|nr:NAD(P)H-binding protein [Planctomyces sp. SH-PL14]AMV20595.1 NmrA-like family protein [Planctomyces sp. SH-PL14]
MKVVVIGGSGLIGSKVVASLRERGHDVLSASPRSGVNAVTGEGLAGALTGADVVVDVSNSPSFEDKAVMEFFERSTSNLMAAEKKAGVKHHVALSVVGAERLPDSGYMRAKVAQEALIEGSGVPYTIVRATQFFEFLEAIAASGTVDGEVRLPTAQFQPVAAVDVASAVLDAVLGAPVNGMVELGGPESLPMSEFIGRALVAGGDGRRVVGDSEARYFGDQLQERALVPDAGARIGSLRYEAWRQSAKA